MSADNFYLIQPHPDGGWTATMGFESAEEDPAPAAQDPQFQTVTEAMNWATEQYSEYGVYLSGQAKEAAWSG